MKIKCDKCGATVETVMPETARDGDIEHTCIPGEGAQCRIVAVQPRFMGHFHA